jgi:hypothetical protein
MIPSPFLCLFWQDDKRSSKSRRTGESGSDANDADSAFRERLMRCLAVLYIRFCAVPSTWLQRTVAAANIFWPGIWEQMEGAYLKIFIEGWCKKQGHYA